MRTFYLETLGCAKNQVESASATQALIGAGWREAERIELADLVILNTCGFITPAREESINAILELASLKKPSARLVMAGCFVQLYARDLAAALPEVDAFFGINFVDQLALHPDFSGIFKIERPRAKRYQPLVGSSLEAGPGAAWLKISDGCDNNCSYCSIPLIRGPFRARPASQILVEAESLAARGVKELNLISQDTSSYHDPAKRGYELVHLLDDLERIPGLEWIRLLYLHPASLSQALAERMARGGKILPYFDIPVQSLIDASLKRMNRRTTYQMIKNIVYTIRELNPLATIRTTLITAYPGEREGSHQLTLKRIAELEFDKLGAFIWSSEPGTPAANERPQPRARTGERRFAEIMLAQQAVSKKRLARWIGKSLKVLVEGVESGRGIEFPLWGRSGGDAPDVDGLVYASLDRGQRPPAAGSFAEVLIEANSEYDLFGRLV